MFVAHELFSEFIYTLYFEYYFYFVFLFKILLWSNWIYNLFFYEKNKHTHTHTINKKLLYLNIFM